MNRSLRLSLILVALFPLSCSSRVTRTKDAPAPAPRAASPIHLVAVQDEAGIDFALGHAGKSPLNILETAGGGCAFLDFDSDGWPDILLVGPHNAALYRNLGNGKFRNVTRQSGIDSTRYWMGCATGDYDGDGRPDIFLTGYRCFALLHNEGGGRFRDVTAESGIGGLSWSLSAVFADFDGDGKLGLFVSQYVKFDNSADSLCTVGTVRSACGPEVYAPLSGKMFRNVDGRRFQSEPWSDSGKTWGALASDLFGRGRPSLYLANDMVPCDLWTLNGGAWKNIGPVSGTGYDGQGNVQGGMGVDSGDYDNDGRLDLLVTTYFGQQTSLYHNDGHDCFSVASGSSGLGPPTIPSVKFGVAFADLDNDGWLDIVSANGHVRDNVSSFDASQSYRQYMQVFRGKRGRFTDDSAQAGVRDGGPIVGRGLAVGDYNRDGKLDILVCNLEGKAVLLENRSQAGHWLDVSLRSSGTNRAGVGSMLNLSAGGFQQIQEVKTCGSVMSGREPVAHFGLGDRSGPFELTIQWPDGRKQSVSVPRADTHLTIDEK